MRFVYITTGFAIALLVHQPVVAAEGPLKRLVMLDFELVDETQDRTNDAAQSRRLEKASATLRQEFDRRGLYQVIDQTPARSLIQDLASRYSLLECDFCVRDIGNALKAERILTAWVQKISDMTLNINIQITDVATGKAVVNKSVYIRSNTDDSWLRGIRYLARSMEDKNQGNK